MSRSGLMAMTLAMFAGCRSGHEDVTTTSPDAPIAAPAAARIPGVEKGWEWVPEATYAATWGAGTVTIRAWGVHPYLGYETRLAMSPLRIWPPQYMLLRRKPEGIVPEVVTPFEVNASFSSDEIVPLVRVQDGRGIHEVPVESAAE